VSSMTDNGIYLVDKVTGSAKTIVEGRLAHPGPTSAVVTEGGKENRARRRRLQLSPRSTARAATVADVLRVPWRHPFPTRSACRSDPGMCCCRAGFSMTVEKIDRKGAASWLATLGEFSAPVDALEGQ